MAFTGRSLARIGRCRRSCFSTSSSKTTLGLLMIPAKPLSVHPTAASTLAVSEFAENQKSRLQIYNVMHKSSPRSQRGVALVLINDLEHVGKTIASQLTPLPAVSADASDDIPEAEVLEYEEPESEEDYTPLPPELQPQAMDDGIPLGNPKDLIMDDFDEKPEMLADLKTCPDFDPNIYDDMIEGWDAAMVKQEFDQSDALDMRNCDNWTNKYDPEAPFFSRDDYAWLKADIRACSEGAVPKLYERLELSIKPIQNVIISDDYTTSSLSSSSPLARHIFIHWVPQSRPCGPQYQNEEFGKMIERMAYLISHEHFRRLTCFRQQDNPAALARWLVLQEFTQLSTPYSDFATSKWLALKKREAEYWWRKNGWDGVVVEFFELQQG